MIPMHTVVFSSSTSPFCQSLFLVQLSVTTKTTRLVISSQQSLILFDLFLAGCPLQALLVNILFVTTPRQATVLVKLSPLCSLLLNDLRATCSSRFSESSAAHGRSVFLLVLVTVSKRPVTPEPSPTKTPCNSRDDL